MSTSIVALGAMGALAQEAAPDPAADPPASVPRLDPITVTATRGERPVDEVPGTVSVITDAEIDRRLVSSLRDLLCYDPGVSIGSDPSHSGLTNCTIRGIRGRQRPADHGVRRQPGLHRNPYRAGPPVQGHGAVAERAGPRLQPASPAGPHRHRLGGGQPTADGIVTSLELFDAAGETIAFVFGRRKPSEPELDGWRALAAGLAAPEPAP